VTQHVHSCEICGKQIGCQFLGCSLPSIIVCSRCSRETFPLEDTLTTILTVAVQEMALVTDVRPQAVHASFTFHVPASVYDSMGIAETPGREVVISGEPVMLTPCKTIKLTGFQTITVMRA